jgi:SpoOM protein
VTDTSAASSGIAWEGDSWGVDWHLELDRRVLLPGRLVDGRVRLAARHAVEARGVVVTLRAEEHWRHRVTQTDGQGHTSTRVVTSRADVSREPVQLHGPLALAAGEVLDLPFQLPVPPLGPASLDAEDAGLDWTVEAKLDVEGGMDSGIEQPIVVAQPTALLRAGAIHLAEFALYEKVDVAAGPVSGTIELHPTPLVIGAAFSGRVSLSVPGSLRLQEIRAELRVHAEATVSSGESEDITAWSAVISPAVELAGQHAFDVAGALADRALPSSELPHGRASATFHVILARAWSPDDHLARDVAIATTLEV